MSPQRLLEVNFIEIQNIHITCLESNCGATITLKLPRHKLPRQLDCPSCGQKLWDSQFDNALHTPAEGLLMALSNWNELKSKKFKLSFSMLET